MTTIRRRLRRLAGGSALDHTIEWCLLVALERHKRLMFRQLFGDPNPPKRGLIALIGDDRTDWNEGV